MSYVSIEKITKVFPGGVRALDELDLEINDGEFFALLGPSGCGKTTLLRTLGGLESSTSGKISFEGKDVTFLTPGARDIAMVFQDYALVPDLTVMENVSLTAMLRKDRTEHQYHEASIDILSKIGLLDRQDHLPRELSGGQQQRVSIARAIVNKPDILFADEPTGNLDPETSDEIMQLLFHISRDYNTTIIMATHDYMVINKLELGVFLRM